MAIRRLGAEGRSPHGGRAGGPVTGRTAGENGTAGWEASWELGGEVTAAARARALVRRALLLWRVPDPADVEDAVLLVDELVTNAILHGTGEVRLRLRLDGRRLTAEVGDDSPRLPRPRRRPDDQVDWAENGRGLMLVAALADDHGARPNGHGKVVWFGLPLRQAAPGPVTAGGLPVRH
ncbi:ATP-binding protein [Thermomonospora cellulosilytica]|uniref:Anti-sigma regulatory factor (Ser/Thr protein kinase) n=1 Tax=Thermomonospora cellulosilytica TaxID=1411118 RepID=A0A7W3N1A0_9ACTN|nr:ATP-binding protein [Thermomonospora cellulosilytica]MBA9005678.1 anti-sigma regulatory factor (Ser/Thr protein kinase) [Thermomonospora cellulosilytica]